MCCGFFVLFSITDDVLFKNKSTMLCGTFAIAVDFFSTIGQRNEKTERKEQTWIQNDKWYLTTNRISKYIACSILVENRKYENRSNEIEPF